MNAILEKIYGIWGAEPVLITTLFTCVLDVAIVFGLPLTADQKTALVAFVTAIGAIVARSQVTPVAKVNVL